MALKTEPIDWQPASEPPDADLTVIIEVDPDSDYSEPVFMGYFDGANWLDVHGVEVDVIAWAEVPEGTQAKQRGRSNDASDRT